MRTFLLSVEFFFFFFQLLQKNLSGIPSVSNSLDPDQAQRFVGPDLGPNCFKAHILTVKTCTSLRGMGTREGK